MNIRANARDYYAAGYQFNIGYQTQTGRVDHDILLGVRYHYDEVRRLQRDDTINVTADGNAPTVTTGLPGSGGNRLEQAHALSGFIQDSISINKLRLTPGVRYEYIDYSYTDFQSNPTNTITGQGDGSTDILAPGIGLNYDVNGSASLFGGVFRGISAPDPRSHARSGVEWEKSIGYEAGFRYQTGPFYGELAGFLTDYQNLTGSDAGLGGSNATNAGEAEVKGIEILARYELFSSEAVRVPLFFSGTWTDATLDNALSAGGGDDIYSGGFAGAEIPYIPEFQTTVGAGVESDKWDMALTATWTADAFGTAANLDAPATSSRQGTIEGGWIADFSCGYRISRNLRFFGGIQNIFDQQLITSRIPDGPRTTAPRMFFVGLDFTYGQTATP
jgi:Fe(3+) dicitrate transport protein